MILEYCYLLTSYLHTSYPIFKSNIIILIKLKHSNTFCLIVIKTVLCIESSTYLIFHLKPYNNMQCSAPFICVLFFNSHSVTLYIKQAAEIKEKTCMVSLSYKAECFAICCRVTSRQTYKTYDRKAENCV